MTMDEVSLLLLYPQKSKDKRLTILVIGSYDNIELLKPALLLENQMRYAGRLHMQFSQSVEEIKNSTSPDAFSDYVVILMDPTDKCCFENVERTLTQVDPAYICGHLCIVNCKCNTKPSDWGNQTTYLKHISEKYQLNLINEDITVPDKCAYAAGRILNIATTVCGYKIGLSVILDSPLNS